MSEEAEKAAKWDMLQESKAARSKFAALRQEAERVGKNLQWLGSVLGNLTWDLRITESSLVGRSSAVNTEFEIPLADLDRKRILALIEDLKETDQRIRTLRQRLEEAGL